MSQFQSSTNRESLPPDSSAAKPSRWLWWLHPKVALSLTLLVFVLLSPFLYRGYRIAKLPVIDEPFNLTEFGTVTLTPEENGADLYRSAIALYRRGQWSIDDFEKALDGGWEQTSEPIRQWVDDNAAALDEWRLATEREQTLFIQPKEMRFDTQLEHVQKMREFSRLVQLRAAKELHDGNVEEAWKWLRAEYRSSRHSGQHGVLIGRLVGCAIHNAVTRKMIAWAEDPRVDAEQLRTALAALDHDWSLTAPQSASLKAEYLVMKEVIERLGHDRDALKKLGVLDQDAAGSFPFLWGEPEYSQRALRLVFENLLTQIDKPLRDRTKRVGIFKLFEPAPGVVPPITTERLNAAVFAHSYVRLLLPALDSCDNAIQREAAQQQTLMLSLASQLYHRQHGDWPTKLDDLVPDILPKLPADPFGKSGETLLLKRDGDELIIYSVGTNQLDDGGQFGRSPAGDSFDEGFRLKRPIKSPASTGQETEPQEKK